ncbi:MAG: LptF/LptG family permease [Bacteroidota bacterium]|jgi:lipopolysaccharide export system permease protein|nr:LptF/LptG family permease [Bacteroidota bacterium]
MKTIDRYILKKFFTTFLFCIIALTVLVIIVDLSEKTDDFAKTKLPVKTIITDYYFGFIPRIDAMLFPLFIFISVIFFTSIMANRSEIIAILSTGISFSRFLRPYFVGGLLFTAFLWWTNQYILPPANQKWATFNSKYIDFNYGNYENTSTVNNKYFKLDSLSYAGVRFYDTTSHTGSNFFVQRFNKIRLVYDLRAQTIKWDTATRKWQLNNVYERTIDGLHQQVKATPNMYMNFNFKPRDLQRDEYMKDKLTTPELNEFIKLEKSRGAADVNSLMLEKQTRNANPVSVFILTIIGASLASRKIRGGSGFHLAIGVVICVLYILVGRFSAVFSLKGNFNPIIAAWLPNLVFGILAWYLYKKASR